MNALHLTLTGVLVVGTVRGQDVDATPPSRRPMTLSAAWMAEHLRHAPHRRLSEIYERVVANPDATAEATEIAHARLVEIGRVSADEQAISAHVRALRTLEGRELGSGVAPLSIDRDSLRSALALPPDEPERDLALERARATIEDEFARNRSYARSLVWIVARRLVADRDAERARIERELNAARAARQTDRVRELENRLRGSRGVARSGDLDRARAWRILLVRLLTEGRFEQAEVLQTRLPPTGTATDGSPRSRLERALADPELAPQERAVLEEFAQQVERWQQDGRAEATRALRLFPY